MDSSQSKKEKEKNQIHFIVYILSSSTHNFCCLWTLAKVKSSSCYQHYLLVFTSNISNLKSNKKKLYISFILNLYLFNLTITQLGSSSVITNLSPDGGPWPLSSQVAKTATQNNTYKGSCISIEQPSNS